MTAELDRLFATDLKSFVEERTRIARALKDAGDREGAKAIEKTPRPPVSAWAVNQIARRAPELVRELGELTARLQGAQGRGAGEAAGEGGYAETAASHRRVLAALRAQAEEILGGAGHAASPQLLQRVVGNLRAAAARADVWPVVVAGRLTRDVEEDAFAGLLGQAPPEGVGPPAPPGRAPGRTDGRKAATPAAPAGGASTDARAAARAAADEQRRREEQARAAARDAARERAAADAQVKALAGASAAARAALDKEQRAVAAARAAVEERQRAVAAARDTLAEAEKRLAVARNEAESSARALAAAEEDRLRLLGRAAPPAKKGS
jgi:hypothetical protein